MAKVTGFRELDRFMSTLVPKVERNLARGSLRAAAKDVLLPAVQAKAPRDTGELAESFKVSTRARGAEVSAKVSTKVFYARFVEYGTRPHAIVAREGGGLSFGGLVFRGVQHPGIVSPKPFMRPALDASQGAVLVAAGEYMKRRLATKHGLDTDDIAFEEVEE